MSINTVLNEYKALSLKEKQTFYQIIQKSLHTADTLNSADFKVIKETRFAHGSKCPHCGSEHIVGHGKYRGRQRYKCKACLITFNDLSFSPMSGTHYADKWPEYIELMCESASIPVIAEKLSISIPTAFYWRHKILNSLKNVEPNELSGIIESDEKFFLESFKGTRGITHRSARKRAGKSTYRGISSEQVCVLVAMSRDGEIISKKAGMGRLSGKEINDAIGNHISSNSILCSDAATNYKKFASLKGLPHVFTNSAKKKYVVDKIYHIQHVNSYHERLETSINRNFKGVSTKYLQNYLAWHRFLEMFKNLDFSDLNKQLMLDMFKGNISSIIRCFC